MEKLKQLHVTSATSDVMGRSTRVVPLSDVWLSLTPLTIIYI